MSKPPLTIGALRRAGFKEVGCWELNHERKLGHKIDLPASAGVYAFAIDGTVQYVGVSARSLRQRFGFYAKPGSTQTTSIRLNEMIRGHIERGAIVEILIAHPPDFDWNGLKVSGPEGLEAGLIREFNLPWNKRGSTRQVELDAKTPSSGNPTDRVLNIISRRPGMTELEIAKAMYGQAAVQQDVNPECRLLVKLSLVERCGVGGKGDPFTYRVRKKADPGTSPG
jgi:hypothetical protein